jgi:hypothetical protein
VADTPQTPEDIIKQAEALKKLQEIASSITFDSVTISLKGLSSQLERTIGNTRELRTNTLANTDAFDKLAKGIGTVVALTTKFDTFKNLQVQSANATQTMGDQFDQLITRMGGWGKASDKLLGAGLKGLVSMGEEGARRFLESASSAQKLENAYINLQGATGKLGEVFDSNNNVAANLSAQVARYGAVLTNVSATTHENIKTVSDFAAQLGTIPNVIGTLIDSGRGFENQLDGLATALTLAKGSSRDTSEVLAVMKLAYENLGNPQGKVTDNALKGTQAFALMSEASNKLGLRFEDTRGYLSHVAEQFKNVGDNTQGATNILNRFSGALQSTGLTAKASIDIVQQMVDSMSKLEMGTKALISVRSGGPGGLQGAFRVENLLREGKTDEVAKMLERSFKQQVGGRIVTQKEAEQSPQAAAEFMRQRELLKSGAFGGLAKDNETATRLLEAISKGPIETANQLTAKDATKNVVEKGNELQKTQINMLDMINNSMDRSVVIQEQSFLATARSAIGAGDKGKPWAEALEQFRLTSSKNTISNYGPGNVNEPTNFASQQKRQLQISAADMMDSTQVFKQIEGIGKNAGAEMSNTVSGILSSAREEGEKNKNIQKALQGQSDTARATQRVQAETLRQRPASLAPEIPKAAQVMKHEVDVKPLEVNINVSRDKDVQVTTTTNYKSANIRDTVNPSIKGYSESVR